MPQLIQAPKKVFSKEIITTKEIVTKEGECKIHVTLDLNINLTSSGVEVNGKPVKEEDKVEWAVPEFSSGQKVKFGKKGN